MAQHHRNRWHNYTEISINIHNSEEKQGLALNYIGQILKSCPDESKKMKDIESLLQIDLNKTHILELAQVLICENWKGRIELIRKR